jgi:hypothetical protein
MQTCVRLALNANISFAINPLIKNENECSPIESTVTCIENSSSHVTGHKNSKEKALAGGKILKPIRVLNLGPFNKTLSASCTASIAKYENLGVYTIPSGSQFPKRTFLLLL